MAYPDWASLPSDLLIPILRNLHSPSDFISFHGVCKSWRSAVLRPCDSPSLPLLFDYNNLNVSDNCLRLFSPFSTESCSIRLPFSRGMWIKGLSQGYLILLDNPELLYLFNPFTRHTISLPPLKFKLPKSTTSQPYLIYNNGMAVISNFGEGTLNLACCKNGDQSWSLVSCKVGANGGGCAYYQGKYYVNEYAEGPTMIVDPASSEHLLSIPPPEDRIRHCYNLKYRKGFDFLVESPMGLLRIFQPWDVFASLKDCSFEIHRLENTKGFLRWVKVGSIGDLMLFLDRFNGICASTNGVQEMQGNCIYFTKYLHGNTGWRGIVCRYDIASGTSIALSHSLETRGSWFVPSMATI